MEFRNFLSKLCNNQNQQSLTLFSSEEHAEMWLFYSICTKPVENIRKSSCPQSRGDHLSERPAASDAVFINLYNHSWGGKRADWSRISMHEPHYMWSHRLGFGLLISLFYDPLLQRYKLVLINCGDISQQLEASCPLSFFFLSPGKLQWDCSICSPSAIFVSAPLPGGIRTFRVRKGQTA